MISIRRSVSQLAGAPPRHWFVVALFIGAESLLVYLAISTVTGGAAFSFWLVLLLLGASHAALTVYHQSWRLWVRQIGSIGLLALAGGFALLSAAGGSPSAGTFILLLAAIIALLGLGWQRASYRQRLDFHDAYQLLRAGVIVLTIVTVISVIAGRHADPELVAGIVAFFALMLIAISEIHKLRERSRGWDETTPRRIAILLVAPVVLLGFVTYVVASLISTSARQVFDPFGGIVQAAASGAGLALTYLVWFLILITYTPLSWLANLLFGANVGEYIPDTDPSPGPIPPTEGEISGAIEPFLQLLLILLATIAIFLLIRYTWSKLPWPESGQDDGPAPVRSSVFSWRDLVRGRSRGRKGNRNEPTPDPLADLRADPGYRHTVAIRESYLAFQQHGRQHDCDRRKGESAPEYGHAIAAFLDATPAIDRLTRIYRRARYSGQPATEQEAEEVRQALEAVQQSKSLEPPPEILRRRKRRRIP